MARWAHPARILGQTYLYEGVRVKPKRVVPKQLWNDRKDPEYEVDIGGDARRVAESDLKPWRPVVAKEPEPADRSAPPGNGSSPHLAGENPEGTRMPLAAAALFRFPRRSTPRPVSPPFPEALVIKTLDFFGEHRAQERMKS